MVRIKAVSDTGPILHLKEIDCLKGFNFCSSVLIPPAVREELRFNPEGLFLVKHLSPKAKKFSLLIVKRYGLDIGESEAIALAKQAELKLLFTDDLEAREVAESFELEPHGSVGILLRAFREKLLAKHQTIKALDLLYKKSSIYITEELLERAKEEVRKFKGKAD